METTHDLGDTSDDPTPGGRSSYLVLAIVASIVGLPLGIWALMLSVLAHVKFQDQEDYTARSLAVVSRFISLSTISLFVIVLATTGFVLPYLGFVKDIF